jgi:ERCC4-related helicase
MSVTPMGPGTAVQHAKLGRGRVLLDEGDAVVVRFDGGIESCTRDELQLIPDVEAALEPQASPPLQVLTRALAASIRSVNDTWGVFSNARVDLLPHQLWVCRRVLERWPMRWLVADDVGLGKTIEAGLILTPLVSSGRVKRLLLLTPASLVEQWQQRLRELFDIRVPSYTSMADTPQADFWGTHPFVIASAQTLRSDRNDRWKRLLEAAAWDLVLIDEAHHVNSDEKGGPTLAFQLITELQRHGKLHSMVFFTGTPHRGKDFGFLSLLSLLWPEHFDPKRPIEEQLVHLRDVMIRNNKRLVTDMNGDPLFQKVRVDTESYGYSPEEAAFYKLLTDYISSGRAYASKLGSAEQRTAMLVLTAMQKLASSSVAAVRRALAGRLARLEDAERKRAARAEEVRDLRTRLQKLREDDDPADADIRASLEEQIAERMTGVSFGPNEVPAIKDLLAAAQQVTDETKIRHIIEIIENRFDGRSVLLFTEYKATQALVMSALRRRFGDECVTFINGDGRIDGVRGASSEEKTLTIDRQEAARHFNDGEVRFLVSTEAAGEGIDLQRRCHTLVHVDLPWNPMRLHQRVGRLDRYGQRHPVEVVSLWNPETVEGRIWQCLDEKLRRITQAFGAAMDDPEDMLQLVLGMSSSGDFEKLFTDARGVPKERLSAWFDAQTATFGGQRAVEVVRELVGNVARFDFGTEKAGLPRVDLPDLVPFFKAMLTLNGRKIDEADDALSFLTPEAWQAADFAVTRRYEGLRFRRNRPGEVARGAVAGVGCRVFDVALQAAERQDDVFAVVPGLAAPLVIIAVRDAVTTSTGAVRSVVVGVAGMGADRRVVSDWELVQMLNGLCRKPAALHRLGADRPAVLVGTTKDEVVAARAWLMTELSKLSVPFAKPRLDSLALLVPEADLSVVTSTLPEPRSSRPPSPGQAGTPNSELMRRLSSSTDDRDRLGADLLAILDQAGRVTLADVLGAAVARSLTDGDALAAVERLARPQAAGLQRFYVDRRQPQPCLVSPEEVLRQFVAFSGRRAARAEWASQVEVVWAPTDQRQLLLPPGDN